MIVTAQPERRDGMRAITYSRYGPPEVLRIEEVSRPVPAADEVLIRVRAVEATQSDCEMRSFRYAVKWFWLPLRIALGIRKPIRRILGSYFAGEVEAVGSGIARPAPGDEVFGTTQWALPCRQCAALGVLPSRLRALSGDCRREVLAEVPNRSSVAVSRPDLLGAVGFAWHDQQVERLVGLDQRIGQTHRM